MFNDSGLHRGCLLLGTLSRRVDTCGGAAPAQRAHVVVALPASVQRCALGHLSVAQVTVKARVRRTELCETVARWAARGSTTPRCGDDCCGGFDGPFCSLGKLALDRAGRPQGDGLVFGCPPVHLGFVLCPPRQRRLECIKDGGRGGLGRKLREQVFVVVSVRRV